MVAKGTRKPIAGAAITVDVAEVGATDARGGFAVDVPCGLRRLSIQAPGFEPLVRTVDPCTTTEPLALRLAPAVTGQSFETVVRAKPAHTEVRLAPRS